MRKITFCLISFLTLSLPCTMSWGEKYQERLNNGYYRESQVEMQQILGDMKDLGKKKRIEEPELFLAGNLLVFELGRIVNPKLNSLKDLRDKKYVLLISGGNEIVGNQFLSDERSSAWGKKSICLGWSSILSLIIGENIGERLERAHIGRVTENAEKDSEQILTGLFEYFRSIAKELQGVEFNYKKEKKEYGKQNLDKRLLINKECAVKALKLMKRLLELRDHTAKFELTAGLLKYFELPTGNFKSSAITTELLSKCEELMIWEEKWTDSDTKAALLWLKRCTHTEVLLHWLEHNDILSTKIGAPILSWKNPCVSCARLPWLSQWCDIEKDKGFFWVQPDHDADKTACDRIRNEKSRLKAITVKDGGENYANGDEIHSTESFINTL